MAGETVVVDDANKALVPEDDEFSAAFKQITDAEAEGADTAKKPDPAPAEASEEGLPPTEAEKAAESAATAEAEAEAARVAAEAAKADAQASKGPQIDAAELARQIVEASKPKPPETTHVDQPEPMFSKEEMDFLATYHNDFPDIAKGEAMVRRAEYRNIVSYVFGEITKELTPLVETVRLLSSRVHLGDIQSQVPDYAVTRDQVVDWVSKQPDFMRVGMQQVVDSGTAAQVAQLVQNVQGRQPAGGDASSAGGYAACAQADDQGGCRAQGAGPQGSGGFGRPCARADQARQRPDPSWCG